MISVLVLVINVRHIVFPVNNLKPYFKLFNGKFQNQIASLCPFCMLMENMSALFDHNKQLFITCICICMLLS